MRIIYNKSAPANNASNSSSKQRRKDPSKNDLNPQILLQKAEDIVDAAKT
jgi:hypothetical protein